MAATPRPTPRALLSMAILAAAAPFASTSAQEVEEASYVTAAGDSVVAQRILIPAARPEVWKAFTTSEGVMSWAAPFARVTLEPGGIWESSYDPEAKVGDPGNIRNRYLAFLPERMLALQAVDAPPDFPHPEVLPELFSVVRFDDADDGRTSVTMYGVGYRDTPAHRSLREMFREANAWSLRMLHRRFVDGPVDWRSMR